MKYLKVVLLKITMGSAIICTNVNATMNYEENKNFSINDSIICNNLSNIDSNNKKLIERNQDNGIQHSQLQSVKTRKNNLWTPQPNTLQSNEEFDFSNIYLKSSSDLCEVSNSRKSTNNSPIQEGKQIGDNISLPNKDTEEYSDYQILGDILKKYKKNINKIKNTNNNKKISTSDVFKDNNIQFRKNIENSIDKTNKNINNNEKSNNKIESINQKNNIENIESSDNKQEILDLINRNIKQKSKENKNKVKNITNRQIDSTCKKTSENLSNNIAPKIKSTCKNNDACNSKIYRVPNGSNILKETNNILEENAQYLYSDTHYYKNRNLMNIMYKNGYDKGNKIALDNKWENSIGKGDVAILLPNQKYYKSAEMVDGHEFKNAFVTKDEEGNELYYKLYNFLQKKLELNNYFFTREQFFNYIEDFKLSTLADIDEIAGKVFLKSSYPKYVTINDETIDKIAELLLSGDENCKNLSKKILENYIRSNCKSKSKSDIIIEHISEESLINLLNLIYEKSYNKKIN